MIGMLATSFIFTPKGSSVFSSAICDSSNNDKSTAEESDKEERKNKSRGDRKICTTKHLQFISVTLGCTGSSRRGVAPGSDTSSPENEHLATISSFVIVSIAWLSSTGL